MREVAKLPKGVRIPDEVQEEIGAMAKQGMRASDIAAETDININTVFRILERQGVPALPVEQPKLGRGQVPNETIQQVVER
jgi:DNA invertase Pin-like site-specific DNA recombinase